MPRFWSRTTLPYSSSITRFRIESTIAASCVAITTVVPVLLIRSRTFMMPIEVAGSMFPVGSSASRIIGRLTNARAIAPRCCSPAGELVGHAVVLAFKAHEVEDLGHHPLDEAPRLADHLEREPDVLLDGLVRQQPEILENAADLAAKGRDLPVRELRQVVASDEDAAIVRPLLAENQAQERGLTRAGGTDEKDELSLVDRHVDVLQGGPILARVDLGDVLKLDHGTITGSLDASPPNEGLA